MHEALAKARQSAQIARNLGVPLEADPEEMLRLLDAIDETLAEMKRLRAALAEERKTRAELGRVIGALGRAGGIA